MTKTSSKNTLKKKLEEGRRRNNIEIEVDLYKKPLVTYLITVFNDGTIKADKVLPPQQPQPQSEEQNQEKDELKK
jgi:hypothetical protein